MRYYESLYNLTKDPSTVLPQPAYIEWFLQAFNLHKITVAQLELLLLTPISIPKIEKAIQSLPLHKSSVLDGFSNEYYKTFSSLLSPHLRLAFNQVASAASFPAESYSNSAQAGETPNSSCQFQTKFVTLNTDLKIYAKILASQLDYLLLSLIHPDQVGFNRSRPMGHADSSNLLQLAKRDRRPSRPFILIRWRRYSYLVLFLIPSILLMARGKGAPYPQLFSHWSWNLFLQL